MKNLKIVSKVEGDNYYKRNIDFFNKETIDNKIINLIITNNIKPKSILEIGCADGNKLSQYKKILKVKHCVGIDLSSQAIGKGKKKYKNLKLLKLSSLEINKLQLKFDLIICGFFLYLLDREELFNQFNLIYKKLNSDGFLIIKDFDPLFKHTNTSKHNKNLKSFKMSYDNFLQESGLFKLIYKIRNNYNLNKNNKKNFKSYDTSLTLFKKIDFLKEYPENI